jgi:hypothetical protein
LPGNAPREQPPAEKIRIKAKARRFMLYTIAVILIVMWLLGMVTAYTMGGFIHLLLVIAIVMVLIRIIQGRNPL